MGVSATATAQGIDLDPIPDKRVIQQRAGVASLDLAGTAEAGVTAVEGRVVQASSGTEVLPWTPIANPAAGRWAGSIDGIPEGGWYRAEVRSVGSPTAPAVASPRFGVGLVVLVLGQSNSARMFTEDAADGSLPGPGEAPHELTWRLGYGEPAGYDYERPAIDLPVTWGPVTGSGGIRFANALQQATGGPVLVLDYALDWTGLGEHWNEGAGPFIGWSKVVAGLAEVEGLGAAVWLQGTYEAVTRAGLVTVDDVKTGLGTLHGRLASASGVADLPLVVSLLNRGDYTQDTTLDASYDVQRRAQAEWITEHPHGWPGGGALDLELSTRPAAGLGHLWASGFAELGDRWALGVLHALGDSVAGPAGPRLVSASISGRTITLEVAHDRGTRLVAPDPQRDLEGFEVTQGDWGVDDLAIERAVLSSEGPANRILLTLAETPTAPTRLRYLAGQNPGRRAATVQQRRGRGNWPRDDFAYASGRWGLPLAPTVVDLDPAPVVIGDRPPSAAPDRGWVPLAGEVTLDVLTNDLDPEGNLDPTSVAVVDPPSSGSALVDPTTGRITYRHDGGALARDTFTYWVDDLAGSTSEVATVTLELLDPGFPAVAGRVLHLEAGRGLETNGGRQITGWRDLSGQGNDVAPAGDPSRIDAGLNGEDCVRFDGHGDKLERTSGLSGLPGLDADRSVFVVGQYRSTGFGGVAWGSPSNGDCASRGNQVFGLIVDPGGLLTVQAWCRDFHSTTTGTGAGWLVQSAVHAGGVLRHFRDGELIDTRTHTFATDADGVLMLGAELDSSPYLDMDLVAVLVYDRALSDGERNQVETYLRQKYLVAPDEAPIAVDDSGVFALGGSTEIVVLANDSDDLGLDPGSVTLVAPPANGTATVDPVTGRITYSHDGSATTADALVYTVADLAGQTSNPATVTLTLGSPELPSAGRVLHLESDHGIGLGFGDEVVHWLDQSPRGNDLVSAGGPLVASGATPSGADAIVFDGGNDRLERRSALMGMPAGNQDRTVLAVARYDSVGFGGISWGTPTCNRVFGSVVDNVGDLAVQGWCLGNDFPTTVAGNGGGWQLHTTVLAASQLDQWVDGTLVDTRTHAFDTDGSGRLVLGAEIDNLPHVAMEVAAVVVYDRALSLAERRAAETYLVEKYLGPPPPPVEDPLPAAGRVLHLESDVGVEVGFGEVTGWLDQSPQGHDVVGIGGPMWTADVTPSGAAAIVLDGSNDRLERLSGLDALPADGDDRSLFVVARYDGPGFGGVGWGSDAAGDCANLGNRAFTLGVDGGGGLAVLGYCAANDHPSGTTGAGAGWMVHSVTLGSGVLRQFRDGRLIDRRPHRFATDGGGGLILGAEIDGQPSVAMALAAVVVYDRYLGEAERTAVESYLQAKYLGRTYDNPAPVAVDDWRTGQIGATVTLDLLANDLDEGVLGPAAIELLDPPTAGSATIDPASGAVVYTHGGGGASYDTLTYRITDAMGQVSTPATLRLALLPSVEGLVLHLDGGLGVVESEEASVLGWLDLSDSANDLVALGDPRWVVGEPGGGSSVRFDGEGDRMVSGPGLRGLPGGNADRTVVLVARYRSRGFGGLAWGSARCDRTFGPVVDHRGRLAVQGYCSDLATQETGNGAGWLVQTVVVEDDFVTHYRDGVPIDGTTHVFDTDGGGNLSLAAEIDGAPQLDMDVAMALVYDRALGDLERQNLEAFLTGKLFEN